MLAPIVSSKSTGSCVSSAEAPRTLASVASRRSCPSIRMAPATGSKKRRIRLSTVLLPAPLGPTSATFWPGAISRLKSARIAAAVLVGEVDAAEADGARA